jgi:hypothetical protein
VVSVEDTFYFLVCRFWYKQYSLKAREKGDCLCGSEITRHFGSIPYGQDVALIWEEQLVYEIQLFVSEFSCTFRICNLWDLAAEPFLDLADDTHQGITVTANLEYYFLRRLLEALERRRIHSLLANAGTTWGPSCLRSFPSSSESVALLSVGKRCLSLLESVALGFWKTLP